MTNTITLEHTYALDADTLSAAREMTFAAFPEGDFTDHDWEHGLGGVHAVARDGDEIVGHCAVGQRHLTHGGRTLRAGYVESVAVRGDHRRQGLGDQLMAAMETVIAAAYDLGTLYATDSGMPLYLSRGWQRWAGPLRAYGPDGIVRFPDDEGSVLVFPHTADLDLEADLICDWRDGDVW